MLTHNGKTFYTTLTGTDRQPTPSYLLSLRIVHSAAGRAFLSKQPIATTGHSTTFNQPKEPHHQPITELDYHQKPPNAEWFYMKPPNDSI